MSLISYAQNFEDIMLWRALKHIEKGFYIDVGAFSPHEDSVTKLFYDHGNWNGINIEPNLIKYNEFLNDRPRDINLSIAISNQEGHLECFFISDKTFPQPNATGLSTFDKRIAQYHLERDYDVKIKKINVSTLARIFRKYISRHQDIHFLKIDVEGFEKEVIQSDQWDCYQPWIILVEAISPINAQDNYKDWEPLLLEAGYSFVYTDRLNRFYISPKHSELREAFNYPPNIFDNFLFYNQVGPFIEKNKSLISQNQSLVGQNQSLVRRSQINEERINSLLQSTSWKITQPLRYFSFLFRSAIIHLRKLFKVKNIVS